MASSHLPSLMGRLRATMLRIQRINGAAFAQGLARLLHGGLIVMLMTMAVSLPGLMPQAYAQLTPGDILVVDFEAGPNGAGILFLLNPATGMRTVLSDFGDPMQGPTGQSPFGVTVVDVNTILVIDNQGISGNGTLFTVNPTTGVRAILSDFSNPAQGPLGVDPVGVVMGPRGDILVTDIDAGTDVPDGKEGGNGALFSINPTNGNRTLLSDFGNPAQGPIGQTPTGIARGVGGAILVIDPDAGTDAPDDNKVGGNGALFEVNPTTGVRTLLSDFGDMTQGPTGVNPGGMALGSGDVILVADTEAGTGGNGVLFSVNPLTGVRTVLSNFGNTTQGAAGMDPFFVAVGATGAILVTDDDAGTDLPDDGQVGGNGALFSVNPMNGNRTLLSDFGDMTQGATGVHPVGVAIVPLTQPGDVLVIDDGGTQALGGTLFSVNPTTGARVIVSDFDNPMQGPGGADPVGVALGTAGDILVVDLNVGSFGALFRVNPVNGARTLLSDFGNPMQGPTSLFPTHPAGVALGAVGDILVVTRDGGMGNGGALFSVDPTTGMRTMLSDFGDPMQGPFGFGPSDVEPGPGGDILVVDGGASLSAIVSGSGALFSVNPTTGMRTVISDFNNPMQGLPKGQEPSYLALTPGGDILVIDPTIDPTGAAGNGLLFSVNPVTGVRTILSGFDNPMQGPTGGFPTGVALGAGGGILVVDNDAGTSSRGVLFGVNPTTGLRTVLSDFGNIMQGPLGVNPIGVAIFQVNNGVGPVHDLAVTKITAPKKAKAASPVTKSVKVQIQNRSSHDEMVEEADLGNGTTTGLVRLDVPVMDSDGEGCIAAIVELDAVKNDKIFSRGAKVLKPKAKLTVNYLVTYNCTSPHMMATGGDYAHVATVHHEVLDGNADSHTDDDMCPRSVAPPFEIDPNPNGTINDKGCGTKKADGTFGDPVVTDVVGK